jgi:RNA polymerase sigma factor (sigma-70 family)
VDLEEVAGHLPDAVAAPDARALAGEHDETLRRTLAQLSDSQRQVIQWRTYDRLPFEEIGRRLGCSAEAARKAWMRAVERLEQILGPRHESG